jgi:predicted HicB family RNase H-like nuclease
MIKRILKEYKGYTATAEQDEGGEWFGKVDLPRDLVTFEGNEEELQGAFEDSVNDYLEMCSDRNIVPEKSPRSSTIS